MINKPCGRFDVNNSTLLNERLKYITDHVTTYYNLGARYFEIGNEPDAGPINPSCEAAMDSWLADGDNGEQFGRFVAIATKAIKALPNNIGNNVIVLSGALANFNSPFATNMLKGIVNEANKNTGKKPDHLSVHAYATLNPYTDPQNSIHPCITFTSKAQLFRPCENMLLSGNQLTAPSWLFENYLITPEVSNASNNIMTAIINNAWTQLRDTNFCNSRQTCPSIMITEFALRGSGTITDTEAISTVIEQYGMNFITQSLVEAHASSSNETMPLKLTGLIFYMWDGRAPGNNDPARSYFTANQQAQFKQIINQLSRLYFTNYREEYNGNGNNGIGNVSEYVFTCNPLCGTGGSGFFSNSQKLVVNWTTNRTYDNTNNNCRLIQLDKCNNIIVGGKIVFDNSYYSNTIGRYKGSIKNYGNDIHNNVDVVISPTFYKIENKIPTTIYMPNMGSRYRLR